MPNKSEWFSFAFLAKSENKEITTQPIRFVSMCDRIPIKIGVFIYVYGFPPTQENKAEHKKLM